MVIDVEPNSRSMNPFFAPPFVKFVRWPRNCIDCDMLEIGSRYRKNECVEVN